MRQRAKSAVGGGVAVAAHHGHAGQGGAVFWTNHVHDALALGHEGEKRRRAKLGDIGVERGNLLFAHRVGNAVVAQFPAGGGRVVVGGGDDGTHAPDLATGFAQALKGLRAGDLVHQVAVYIEDGRAVFFGVDDVFVPNLVVQGAAHETSLCAGKHFMPMALHEKCPALRGIEANTRRI